MSQYEGKAFRVYLTTKGRKTGNEHRVMLRAVMYLGEIYFSRHMPDSDWYQNTISNPQVFVEFEGKKIPGTASIVTDDVLSQKISELKYPGEDRAREKRVTVRIKLEKN